MIDNARQIKYNTFLKNVDKDSFREVAQNLGYSRQMHIKNDWAVTFAKSKLFGKTVYFFVWSAIEYIFTPNGNLIHENT